VLRAVHLLVAAGTPIEQIEADPVGIGALVLRLGDHRLTLGGIATAVRARVEDVTAGDGPAVLSGAGRYNNSWWVNLAGGAGSTTVLAARLRLVAARGGVHSPGGFTSVSPHGPTHRADDWLLAHHQGG
jgi:hypothetical protein